MRGSEATGQIRLMLVFLDCRQVGKVLMPQRALLLTLPLAAMGDDEKGRIIKRNVILFRLSGTREVIRSIRRRPAYAATSAARQDVHITPRRFQAQCFIPSPRRLHSFSDDWHIEIEEGHFGHDSRLFVCQLVSRRKMMPISADCLAPAPAVARHSTYTSRARAKIRFRISRARPTPM